MAEEQTVKNNQVYVVKPVLHTDIFTTDGIWRIPQNLYQQDIQVLLFSGGNAGIVNDLGGGGGNMLKTSIKIDDYYPQQKEVKITVSKGQYDEKDTSESITSFGIALKVERSNDGANGGTGGGGLWEKPNGGNGSYGGGGGGGGGNDGAGTYIGNGGNGGPYGGGGGGGFCVKYDKHINKIKGRGGKGGTSFVNTEDTSLTGKGGNGASQEFKNSTWSITEPTSGSKGKELTEKLIGITTKISTEALGGQTFYQLNPPNKIPNNPNDFLYLDDLHSVNDKYKLFTYGGGSGGGGYGGNGGNSGTHGGGGGGGYGGDGGEGGGKSLGGYTQDGEYIAGDFNSRTFVHSDGKFGGGGGGGYGSKGGNGAIDLAGGGGGYGPNGQGAGVRDGVLEEAGIAGGGAGYMANSSYTGLKRSGGPGICVITYYTLEWVPAEENTEEQIIE